MAVAKPVGQGGLRRGLAVAGRVLLTLLLAASAVWGCLALAYQAPGGAWGKGAAGLVWTALCVGAVLALWFKTRWRASW